MRIRSRLARLSGAAGLLLASTAVAVATGVGPAQATVVNVSVAGAFPNQSAVATCPAGEFLAGGGGFIDGGGGDVTLTDIIPNLATQSVTVWAHTNPGGVAGAYNVVAQAICVPGAPPANYQRVTSASGSNVDPIKNQVAACPAGTDLLGLGAELRTANGEAFYQRIEPNAALTAGVVTAGAAGGFAGPWELVGYAICATLPANLTGTLVSLTGAANSVSPRGQVSGGCPAGALATGVGATVTDTATGNVLLTRVTATVAQNSAQAIAFEDGVYLPPWDLESHAICWGP
ncbi:hypothetical protein [Micromonospora sp. NPDC049891]|uniref:hypothetical protein n=1 Tax=Micromonospora sp. NPDC049891 TaxID=3155655 RepID=UPI0033CCCA6D